MARPRSPFPAKTPAQRQAKCRAVKRGKWRTIPGTPVEQPLLPPGTSLALPRPVAVALPPPAVTAIQRATTSNATALTLPDAEEKNDAMGLNLPRASADRLRALLARQFAGKALSATEREEAQGLLDVAEFFVIQRLRNQLGNRLAA